MNDLNVYSEYSNAVLSANWREELLMRRQLAAIDKCEQAAVRSVKVDQRLVCDNYHTRLLRYEMSCARADGDEDCVRSIRQLLHANKKESLRKWSDDILHDIKGRFADGEERRASMLKAADGYKLPPINAGIDKFSESVRNTRRVGDPNVKYDQNNNTTEDKDVVAEDVDKNNNEEGEYELILPAITVHTCTPVTPPPPQPQSRGDLNPIESSGLLCVLPQDSDGLNNNLAIPKRSTLLPLRRSVPNVRLTLANPEDIDKLRATDKVSGRSRRHSLLPISVMSASRRGSLLPMSGMSALTVDIDARLKAQSRERRESMVAEMDERVKELCERMDQSRTPNHFYDVDYYNSRMVENT